MASVGQNFRPVFVDLHLISGQDHEGDTGVERKLRVAAGKRVEGPAFDLEGYEECLPFRYLRFASARRGVISLMRALRKMET